jgi:hypothetical protein
MEILDFLFPGNHSYTFPGKDHQDNPAGTDNEEPEPDFVVRGQKHQQPCYGGHATDHEPALRHQLVEIVRSLDRDLYASDLSRINDLIGCNGTVH